MPRIVSASGTPLLLSRMSLRKMSAFDGYGPAVSLGTTAHASSGDDVPPVAPVPVVAVEPTAEGLVAVSLPQAAATAAAPAAPMMRMTSRRSTLLLSFCMSVLFIQVVDAADVAELWRRSSPAATLLQHVHQMIGPAMGLPLLARAPGHGRWLGWSRSLYWRIAMSSALFTAGRLVAQNLLFSYLRERPNPSFLSPNAMAMLVAADIQETVASSPSIDLGDYLRRRYADPPQRIYVALRDGRIGGNTASPMPEDIRRATVATLDGANVREATSRIETRGPVVTAPIQVGSELRGIVVLPPPPPDTAARALARVLSVPGTLILITAAFLVSAVVFSPARRRLQALESAAERLGSGDLSARAPDAGADEVARVARAFHVMAAELATRDEALRTSDRLRRQMVADVSHELKTPLTSMRGYVETLRLPDIALSPMQRSEYLDTIEHETKRLERIVQDLLDIARLENGVVAFERRYFATEQLFAHVVQRHRAAASGMDVEIIASVDASADQLFGDPYRLEQGGGNPV